MLRAEKILIDAYNRWWGGGKFNSESYEGKVAPLWVCLDNNLLFVIITANNQNGMEE